MARLMRPRLSMLESSVKCELGAHIFVSLGYLDELIWPRESFCRDANSFQVFVKIFGRSTITLEVVEDECVAGIKIRSQDLAEIPEEQRDQQRLSFDEERLDDTKTLSDCNVHKGSKLCLVGRY